MKPTNNCSKTYNPLNERMCSKCCTDEHHEFQCNLYIEYNPDNCSYCHRGNHFSEHCKKKKENNLIVSDLMKNDLLKTMMEKNE